MLRMIDYKTAKSILGVSGSSYSNNREVWKKWAIDNGADPTPFNAGGKFAAWVNNRLVPVEAVNKITYAIRFIDYDGTLLREDTDKTEGESVTPPSPTREGYTLTGWKNTTTGIVTPAGTNITVSGNAIY